MLNLNKSFLSILSLFMLFCLPIAHSESSGLHQKESQQQSQIQRMQAQLKNANSKIIILEAAINTANKDINGLRDCEASKQNSRPLSDTANTVVTRTANGHGR
jgi:peptidoglycan hydrolase CwlO-like protein